MTQDGLIIWKTDMAIVHAPEEQGIVFLKLECLARPGTRDDRQ